MTTRFTTFKPRTSSFQNLSNVRSSMTSNIGFSPGRSEDRIERQVETYKSRFLRKDLREFQPSLYVAGTLTIDDVIDLKEVFDTYDSTGMGVLLPNDLKLLLNQNDFQPNKNTIYEIMAEFDVQQTGGISFAQFMKAVLTKPYLNENKKQIGAVFKRYDRNNKGYLDVDDLKEMNRHIKQNLDEGTIRLMLDKADSNNDGKISFEDFYSVMVKDIY